MEQPASNWTSVAAPKGTVFDLLNKGFEDKPGALPSFKDSASLFIGSDYSGESKEEPFVVYSFLMAGSRDWQMWEDRRTNLRKKIMPDARRMSYKKLGERFRREFLMPILQAADELNGLSFTIAISKQCPSLFPPSGPSDLKNPDFYPFLKWKSEVLTKAFTILHCMGILVAGTARKGQNIFWFTDEDAIAANHEMLKDLTKAFGWVSSSYLKFDLGHLRCGTTKSDDGNLQIEDFVAIPDLIAGALSEQFRASLSSGTRDDKILWISGADMKEKAQPITFWFGTSQKNLKRGCSESFHNLFQ